MSWAESDTGRLVAAVSEEGESAVRVSGFGVGQSAGPRVFGSLVVCGSVREWRARGSILAEAGMFSLLCAEELAKLVKRIFHPDHQRV